MRGRCKYSFSFFRQCGVEDIRSTTPFISPYGCVFPSHFFTLATTVLGAPNEDTALSVLPAHSLLLEGKGFEAVALSAMGSYGAIIICFLVLLPIRSIIGWPVYFYETLREIMIFVLISISILMLATEKGKITDFGTKGKKPAIIGMLFCRSNIHNIRIFWIYYFEFFCRFPHWITFAGIISGVSRIFWNPYIIDLINDKT